MHPLNGATASPISGTRLHPNESGNEAVTEEKAELFDRTIESRTPVISSELTPNSLATHLLPAAPPPAATQPLSASLRHSFSVPVLSSEEQTAIAIGDEEEELDVDNDDPPETSSRPSSPPTVSSANEGWFKWPAGSIAHAIGNSSVGQWLISPFTRQHLSSTDAQTVGDTHAPKTPGTDTQPTDAALMSDDELEGESEQRDGSQLNSLTDHAETAQKLSVVVLRGDIKANDVGDSAEIDTPITSVDFFSDEQAVGKYEQRDGSQPISLADAAQNAQQVSVAGLRRASDADDFGESVSFGKQVVPESNVTDSSAAALSTDDDVKEAGENLGKHDFNQPHLGSSTTADIAPHSQLATVTSATADRDDVKTGTPLTDASLMSDEELDGKYAQHNSSQLSSSAQTQTAQQTSVAVGRGDSEAGTDSFSDGREPEDNVTNSSAAVLDSDDDVKEVEHNFDEHDLKPHLGSSAAAGTATSAQSATVTSASIDHDGVQAVNDSRVDEQKAESHDSIHSASGSAYSDAPSVLVSGFYNDEVDDLRDLLEQLQSELRLAHSVASSPAQVDAASTNASSSLLAGVTDGDMHELGDVLTLFQPQLQMDEGGLDHPQNDHEDEQWHAGTAVDEKDATYRAKNFQIGSAASTATSAAQPYNDTERTGRDASRAELVLQRVLNAIPADAANWARNTDLSPLTIVKKLTPQQRNEVEYVLSKRTEAPHDLSYMRVMNADLGHESSFNSVTHQLGSVYALAACLLGELRESRLPPEPPLSILPHAEESVQMDAASRSMGLASTALAALSIDEARTGSEVPRNELVLQRALDAIPAHAVNWARSINLSPQAIVERLSQEQLKEAEYILAKRTEAPRDLSYMSWQSKDLGRGMSFDSITQQLGAVYALGASRLGELRLSRLPEQAPLPVPPHVDQLHDRRIEMLKTLSSPSAGYQGPPQGPRPTYGSAWKALTATELLDIRNLLKAERDADASLTDDQRRVVSEYLDRGPDGFSDPSRLPQAMSLTARLAEGVLVDIRGFDMDRAEQLWNFAVGEPDRHKTMLSLTARVTEQASARMAESERAQAEKLWDFAVGALDQREAIDSLPSVSRLYEDEDEKKTR